MRIRSVRWRITALAVVISAVVLGACAVAVVLVMRAELIDNIDGSLSQRADEVAAAVAADPARPLANRDPEDRFAQVLDGEGNVLLATDNVAGLPTIVGLPDGSRAFITHTEPAVDEDPLRVMIRRFDTDGGLQYVVVGESVDDINETVRSLVLALLVTIPIAVAVLGAMVWWLVGRTLEPVSRIRREVDVIGLGELDRRVPSPGTGDEIDELATTMNAMLARLEESAGRQRRFVSDASHELRTPLARMRSTIEVELAQTDDQRSESSLESTCRSALDEVVAMQDLVDDLLLVARNDTGGARRESKLVDLDVIVDEEVRQVRPASNIRIDMTRVSAATVTGDASQLARVRPQRAHQRRSPRGEPGRAHARGARGRGVAGRRRWARDTGRRSAAGVRAFRTARRSAHPGRRRRRSRAGDRPRRRRRTRRHDRGRGFADRRRPCGGHPAGGRSPPHETTAC